MHNYAGDNILGFALNTSVNEWRSVRFSLCILFCVSENTRSEYILCFAQGHLYSFPNISHVLSVFVCIPNVAFSSSHCGYILLQKRRIMGKLLSLLARDDSNCCTPKTYDVFLDFENAAPTETEREIYDEVERVLRESEAVLEEIQCYKVSVLFFRY